MNLGDWLGYMKTLPNKEDATISDVFTSNDDDYELEAVTDGFFSMPYNNTTSSNLIFNDAYTNFGIGNTNPQHKLDVGGNIGLTGTLIVKGNSINDSGSIKLNCELNTHYVELKAPSHSDFSGDITYVLPSLPSANDKVLTSDVSGNLEWVDKTIPINAGTNIVIDANNNVNVGQLQDSVYRLNYESLLHPTLTAAATFNHPTINGNDVSSATISNFKYLTENNEHFLIFMSDETSVNTTFDIDFGSSITIERILLVGGGGAGGGGGVYGEDGGEEVEELELNQTLYK